MSTDTQAALEYARRLAAHSPSGRTNADHCVYALAQEVEHLRCDNAALRDEIERWRDSNRRLRSEMEHQSLRDNATLRNSHAAIYQAIGTNEADHTKWPAQIAALRAAGNEMARIIDIPKDAAVERWATEPEIDAALRAWRAALAAGGAK